MKELRAGMAVFLMLTAAACASHASTNAGPAPLSREDSAGTRLAFRSGSTIRTSTT